MLKKLDEKYTEGQELYYHCVGKKGTTKRFEVFTRTGAKIVGHISWHYGKYKFFGVPNVLSEQQLIEIAAFIRMHMDDLRSTWKPRKNKFNKTYDRTKIDEKKGQKKLKLEWGVQDKNTEILAQNEKVLS